MFRRVLTRRGFLATVGALAAAACNKSSAAHGRAASSETASRRRLERIGIQLYAVRPEMQRDFSGTLARLAEIGYRDVEFAGYYRRTPLEIRALLEQHRLSAPSTHISYDLIAKDWTRALDDAATIGHRYVTIPWLPSEARRSADSWRRVADAFNRAGEQARGHKLRFAYHNHDFDFTSVDGVIPLDILLAETDAALVAFQMDVFWLVKGGGDPLAYLRKYPGRFTMLHIKDSSGPPKHAQVDIGDGSIDFAAILRLDASQQKTIAHVFAEHDTPGDAMAFAKKGFDYLSKLEY